uniref:MSP domain-containing protein n=1 Tax=Leersia perrieri TaxID=77586 RepID=A0A0D9VX17_9ORYZ
MDRLVIPEPTNEVVVRVEPGRPARGELTLRNAMHTMPVAFRLQPAVRGRFSVRPHTGILAPLAAVTVEVVYLPAAAPDGPGGGVGSGEDAFLLHSVVAPGAAVREPVTALDSVNPEWFSARRKQVFVDSGIRACFVGAAVASRLVEAGAVEALREVLDRSEPEWRAADAVDESGRTLLDLAVGLGRADIVQVLLEYGADADKPSRGRTPLETAAASGECLIAELLLANGATPAGSDALHVAAAAGHDDVLKLLLGKPASASPSPSVASSASSFSSSFTSIDAAGRDGKTPLRVAAEAGRRDAGRDAHGWTPLMRAAFKGRADAARDLVARGADVEAADAEGYTALHCAAEAGRADVVDLLLKSGANAKATTAKGRSAAEVAAAAGRSKVVRLLEKAGGVGCKEIAEKASPAAVGKTGSLDRRRRGRKGSSGAIRFGGGKEGFETAAVTVGWSH